MPYLGDFHQKLLEILHSSCRGFVSWSRAHQLEDQKRLPQHQRIEKYLVCVVICFFGVISSKKQPDTYV